MPVEPRFAMNTRSWEAGNNSRFRRNTSRTTRLMRFLSTALPTFFVTVIPSRVFCSAFGWTTMRKWGVWIRRPLSCACLNSSRFFSRSPRRNRCGLSLGAPVVPDARGILAPPRLLLVTGHGKARAPLATTSVDDGPSASGLHTRAEPVCPKTALTMWLIGPLHCNAPEK